LKPKIGKQILKEVIHIWTPLDLISFTLMF
jgi:hypothetical protein